MKPSLFLFFLTLIKLNLFSQVITAEKRMFIEAKGLDKPTLQYNKSIPKNKKPIGSNAAEIQNLKERTYYSSSQPRINTANCSDTSSRLHLYKDSFLVSNSYITKTSDSSFLIPGFSNRIQSPWVNGHLIKCTESGNFTWKKDLEKGNLNRTMTYKAFELRDKSTLLIGDMNIPMPVNGRQELLLTKLSSSGVVQWEKTFKSSLWYSDTTNGSFDIYDCVQDSTGDIYLCGDIQHNGNPRQALVFKINSIGLVLWSKAYTFNYSPKAFGLDIVNSQLRVFISTSISTQSEAVFIYTIDKLNGASLSSKSWDIPANSPYGNSVFARNFTKLDNGGYALYGSAAGDIYNPYPNQPYKHHGVIELDQNLEFVRSYILSSHQQSDFYNTRFSVFKDGTAAYSRLYDISDYSANVIFGTFEHGQISKERMIRYNGVAVLWTSNFLQSNDGGQIVTQYLSDSITNKARIGFLKLHKTDTSSHCLGLDTLLTEVTEQIYTPAISYFDSTDNNVLIETYRNLTGVSSDTLSTEYVCNAISYCDTLKLSSTQDTICTLNSLQIHIYKNKECGSPVSFSYDSTKVSSLNYLNDSTVVATFNSGWVGYIIGTINSCNIYSDSIKITVLKSPDSLNLGLDTFLCPGNTITLNAHSGYKNYEWQDGSTDSVFTVLQPGIYHVKATNACGDVFFDTINVFPRSGTLFSLGPDRSKCNKDSIQLNAPSGFQSYSWSPDYNIINSGSQSPQVFPDTTTSYILAAEKPAGCFSRDTIKVIVNRSPIIDLGTDTSICETDSLVLNAGSGFINYQWSTGSISPHITINAVGSYWVNATDANTCRSTDTIKLLSKYPDPVVTLNKDTILCSNTTKTLDAGGGFLSYLWQNGSSNQTLVVSDTGRYWVQVKDSHFCKGSDTTYIKKITTTPSGFLPLDSTKCSYGSILISPLQNFEEYIWNNGQINASIFITDSGLYILKVKDNFGCEGSDSIRIYTKDCIKGVFFPNAFTPNGKAPNDFFKPLVFGKLNFIHLSIYNRWGVQIFDSHNPSAKWDGNFKGIKQPSGTYIWVCNYQLEGETVRSQKGYLVLIR